MMLITSSYQDGVEYSRLEVSIYNGIIHRLPRTAARLRRTLQLEHGHLLV
jgi:hypothetical protein